MNVTCEYCGHQGVHGEDIETRVANNGRIRDVCIDKEACDERDERRERAQETEAE